jgi:hypothetical protein
MNDNLKLLPDGGVVIKDSLPPAFSNVWTHAQDNDKAEKYHRRKLKMDWYDAPGCKSKFTRDGGHRIRKSHIAWCWRFDSIKNRAYLILSGYPLHSVTEC